MNSVITAIPHLTNACTILEIARRKRFSRLEKSLEADENRKLEALSGDLS